MTTTSTATPAATVIPLQRVLARSEQPPARRSTADRSLPPSSDTTWYDAELAAMFAGEALTRHGRRCSCCTPDTAVEAVS